MVQVIFFVRADVLARTFVRTGLLTTHSLVFALFTLVFGGVASAKEEEDPLSFDRHIQQIFQRYCFRCHNADSPSGDVDLRSDENLRLILSHRKQWENVREVLKSGEMPPEDERQPQEDQRVLMIQFLDRTLDTLRCNTNSDPKTPPARRLTRHQYDRTVANFTGLELRLADSFSPDPVSFGFEGISSSQGLTQVITDQYAAAAAEICAALLESRDSHPQVYANFFELSTDQGIDSLANERREQLTRTRLQDAAQLAHRRRPEKSYVEALMKVYRASYAVHSKHDHAVADAVRGILMSPRFFMRIESDVRRGRDDERKRTDGGEDPDDQNGFLVGDVDLANRLSYFLWSSPPDQKLMQVAIQGELRKPGEIQKQVQRMLKSDLVRFGLVREFFGQWLQVNDLTDHTVNKKVFPGFNEALRESMIGEVEHFLTEMIQQNLSITSLIDSDFTFVDQRLAKHYSWDQQLASTRRSSQNFVRIQLDDRRRGGLLTSAALLTLQADPGRTNIPRRGNYIAATFLADPPPPPPPNVPALVESDNERKSMTLREVFERHRADAACASCHAKMDPIGFALEHFDAIGRWREKDNGLPIDTRGKLPSGDQLDGVISLKDYLLERRGGLTRSLTESLLVYALGRGLIPEDECVVREVIEAVERNEGEFGSVIETIVLSRPFRYRSNP